MGEGVCIITAQYRARTRVFIVFAAKALTRQFCNRLLHPFLQTCGGGQLPSLLPFTGYFFFSRVHIILHVYTVYSIYT